MTSADLLLHPVRLRIVQAFLGERELTTSDVRARLPDVSPATLYRQVATLVHADVLEVAAEHRVRGAVERTYRLNQDRVSVDADGARGLSAEDHRATLQALVAGVLADADRYLDRDDIDPGRDRVGYRQVGFYATDEEVDSLLRTVREALGRLTGHGPGEGRTRRLLTTVLLPADP